MRIRPLFIAMILIVAILAGVMASAARACETKRCAERVGKRVAHTKWKKAVRGYGIGVLQARARCESGANYKLQTTGNGFWFSMQFEPRAWYAAGGRKRHGHPVGVWTRIPGRLEQQYRAVIWDHKHGGDPWPSCI